MGIYFSVGGTPLFLWKKAPIDFGTCTVSLPLNFALSGPLWYNTKSHDGGIQVSGSTKRKNWEELKE